MIYTDLTRKAMEICYQVHAGQHDKAGTPYVFHPYHLAEQMETEQTVCAALLHDVLEESDMTAADLTAAGFPAEIVEAVVLLTHEKQTPYLEYVAALLENPIARAVKEADVQHNADLSRLPVVTTRDRMRMEKYAGAKALFAAHPAQKKVL